MMLNIWIAVGGIFYGKRPVKLAQNPTSGCFPGNLTVTMNGSSMYSYDTTTSLYDITGNLTMSQSDPTTSSKGFFLYDISYTWYGLIGFLLTMIIGTVVSLSTGGDRDESVKVHLIFPVCRKLFGLKSNSTNESEDKTLSLMPPNATNGDSLISYSECEEPNVPTL
ncbi:uncharacterized protein LOC117320462 [Pecten maximus]|uniref:uncharacterized protein LOC117320462 n=1 Tax=Pecten maximus TaxID=6579 RepID=UPI001457FA3F|nr:uncharacterized protein LOC117320462 [Pecten maximus]